MFWVVDNFLMKKGRTKAKLEEREVGEDPRGSSKVRYRRALSHDDSESEVRAGCGYKAKVIVRNSMFTQFDTTLNHIFTYANPCKYTHWKGSSALVYSIRKLCFFRGRSMT